MLTIKGDLPDPIALTPELKAAKHTHEAQYIILFLHVWRPNRINSKVNAPVEAACIFVFSV